MSSLPVFSPTQIFFFPSYLFIKVGKILAYPFIRASPCTRDLRIGSQVVSHCIIVNCNQGKMSSFSCHTTKTVTKSAAHFIRTMAAQALGKAEDETILPSTFRQPVFQIWCILLASTKQINVGTNGEFDYVRLQENDNKRL